MRNRSVYLETFGCQMNELDSQLVAGALRSLGYVFTDDPGRAGIVLYNTCSVREHAEQKVWSRLGELAVRKRSEPGLVVGVLGCMAERDGVALVNRMPVVDVLCGPGELDKLPALVDNAVRTRESMLSDSPSQREGAGGWVPTPSAYPMAPVGDQPKQHQDAGPGSPHANRLSRSPGLNPPPNPLPRGGGVSIAEISARQIALQGSSSRRSATLAAAEDTLELLDLSRAISPTDLEAGGVRGSAYVRITRGCNKFCTYCVVPFTRGAEMHRPPDHIVDECKRLADAGAVEVTLLGQTVNHYRFEHGAAVSLNGVTQPQKGRVYVGTAAAIAGVNGGINGNGHTRPGRRDAYARANVTTFADLLRRIHDEVPAIRRLRFVTSYPRDFGDDLLEVMRHHPRLCRYLHAPAQSGSDRILKLMNRGYVVGEYLEFLDRARAALDQPEIGRPLMISGDIIVGFPTETDGDFAATAALVRRARYKNCFIFKYSPRPGTPAYGKLADDVPDADKRRRNNELLAIQSGISDELSRGQVGRTFEVFIEGVSRRSLRESGLSHSQARKAGPMAITVGGRGIVATTADEDRDDTAEGRGLVQLAGRTDTDMIVFINIPTADAPALVGSIVPVRVTSADRLSLHGEIVPGG